MSLRIDLTDRHDHHPEAVRTYAREKVEKLSRFFDGLQSIDIVLDKEHDNHSVEVIIAASNHMNFVGRDIDASVMACIDKVVDKLQHQIVKAKERLKDHHRGGSPNRPS
ncbi:MAG: ribosome-associated translation inhibitor RaiA [Planctomycetes bacterium]|nr:ribosome-associated translation inhibitor RaiA [Planctomycetota bacterium]